MQRWILHVDMNSYFASVEQQSNPALRGKPVGVGGKPGTRSVIAAASREAKVRGVLTAMPVHEALAICPELIIVEPDYPKYQATSERMFGILESFSPDLEIFSIDEAFLEVTDLLKHSPKPTEGSRLRSNSNDYSSTRMKSGGEVASYLVSTALSIRERLRAELGEVLTASIGIAHNKRLAKLASESQKPNGLTVLLDDTELDLVDAFRRVDVRAFTRKELFATTDIEALAGIGHKLGRRLRAIGVHTLADIATRTLGELETAVFPYHKELWLIGRGQDPSLVVPYWAAKPEQSIGHQYTLPKDVPVIELPSTIAWLAERVGRRLRRGGFVAHAISIYLRQTNGPGWHAVRRVNHQLETDHDIYLAAWDLIRAAADDPGVGIDWGSPIRMPSLTVSHLVARTNATQSLLPAEDKWGVLTPAMDEIRDRFGERSLISGLSVDVAHHLIPDGRRKRFNPVVSSS